MDLDGMNILHLAIKFYPAIVSNLLVFLENHHLENIINEQTTVTRKTPLHLAASMGHIDIVRQDLFLHLFKYQYHKFQIHEMGFKAAPHGGLWFHEP